LLFFDISIEVLPKIIALNPHLAIPSSFPSPANVVTRAATDGA
jgi:hypothetical protein